MVDNSCEISMSEATAAMREERNIAEAKKTKPILIGYLVTIHLIILLLFLIIRI